MIEFAVMKQAHVAQIAALEQLCFSHPWSVSAIEGELSNPLSLWIVAIDGDTVAGYVGSQSVMGEADMMNLAVTPDRRREGIGEALVNTLVEHLKRQDVYSLTLEVRASNAGAIGLYRKLGFTQTGRRPNYYSSPREDALILRKEWQL